MVKTTVYLPEQLKRRLEQLARRSGRSEADLVRAALEQFVGDHPQNKPRLPLFASGDPHLAERVDEALTGFGE